MQLTPQTLELNTELESYENASKTYKIDFIKNKISSEIEDLEALKQTIYCILNTERYENIIYSWNYGSEFKELIGKEKDFIMGDLKRRIGDALSVDDRIKSVDDFEVFEDKNNLRVEFVVTSIYGEIPISQEVQVS